MKIHLLHKLAALLLALATPALFADPVPTPDAIAEATALIREKKYDKARHALIKLQEANPKDAAITHQLTQLSFAQKNVEEACRWAQLTVDLEPNSAKYQITLGDATGSMAGKASLLSKAGYAKRCRLAYEKAVELEPNNVRSRIALAGFYWQAPGIVGGGKTKAHAQVEALRAISPEDALRVHAGFNHEDQLHAENITLSQAYLTKDPTSAVAYFVLGRACANSGQQPEAGLKAFEKYRQLPPPANPPAGPAQIEYLTGRLHEHLKQNDLARQRYEAVLKLQPGHKQATEALGKLPKS